MCTGRLDQVLARGERLCRGLRAASRANEAWLGYQTTRVCLARLLLPRARHDHLRQGQDQPGTPDDGGGIRPAAALYRLELAPW